MACENCCKMGYSTCENGSHTLTGQRSGDDSGGLGTKEPFQDMIEGVWTLPSANGSIGWPSRSSTGEPAQWCR